MSKRAGATREEGRGELNNEIGGERGIQGTTEHPTTHSRRTRILPKALTRIQTEVERTIKTAQHSSTTNRQNMITREMQRFHAHFGLQVSEESLLWFTHWLGRDLAPTTRINYALTIRKLFPLAYNAKFDKLIYAYRKEALRHTPKQAIPMSQREAYKVIAEAPKGIQIPLLVAWKTASRWSDVQMLQRKDVQVVSPKEAVIQFVQTKQSLHRPFRVDHTVMMEAQPHQINQLAQMLAQMSPHDNLTKWSTRDLLEYLHKRYPTKSWTAHSIKRGALTHLARMAAEQKLNPALIPQLGKHIGGQPLLPDTTVRYIANAEVMARMNKSQLATRML